MNRNSSINGKIVALLSDFGNCISSVHSTAVAAIGSKPENPPNIRCGPFSENRIRRTYADVPVGEPLGLPGSCAFLEIAARQASAAGGFGITRGQSTRASARKQWESG